MAKTATIINLRAPDAVAIEIELEAKLLKERVSLEDYLRSTEPTLGEIIEDTLKMLALMGAVVAGPLAAYAWWGAL